MASAPEVMRVPAGHVSRALPIECGTIQPVVKVVSNEPGFFEKPRLIAMFHPVDRCALLQASPLKVMG